MRFDFATWALLSAIFAGCGAAGVMATSDPKQKLLDADQLLRTNRPLPAERLIREAIDRYREQHDLTGLGWAQKYYGDFVRTAAFAEWPQFRQMYPDTGTRDQRRILAHDYYMKAIASFRASSAETGVSDERQSTNYFLTYLAYRADEDTKGACEALTAMTTFAREAVVRHPGTLLVVPKPYRSGEEFYAAVSSELNCPEETGSQ